MTEQQAHSPIGASSCERWWNCPGSVALMKTVPEDTGSIHAATGTVAHSIGEKWLKSGIWQDDLIVDEIGRTYEQDGFEIEVTEEMLEAVEVYKNTVWSYLMKYNLKHYLDLKTEVRFALPHIDAEAFGTCDTMIHVPMNRLIIIDYKHGQGVSVDVEDNKQLLYYSLGAYYSLTEQERTELVYVETVIVQPRARHLDGGVRTHLYTVAELLTFEAELVEAVARVRNDDKTVKSGKHCKWCTAKAICPEVRNELERQTNLDFSKIETEPVSLPSLDPVSPERLAQLLVNMNTLDEFSRSVRTLAFNMAERGVNIPGYKIVQGKANRRWVDAAKAEEHFKAEFGERVYKKSFQSPAQMEKLLGKGRKSEVGDFVETPPGAKSLVPIEDERPSLSTAVDDFTPVK